MMPLRIMYIFPSIFIGIFDKGVLNIHCLVEMFHAFVNFKSLASP